MESQSSFLVLIFFLCFLLLWFAKGLNQKNKAKILVPGPWKLPVLGNLHQLAAANSLPHRALRELAQKYGPLMHLQVGKVSAVFVSSPEIAKQIMKTRDLAFVQRPEVLSSDIMFYGSTDIAFAPYGDYWRHMKKICASELLSSKMIQSFSYIREDEVDKLMESLQSSAGSPINLSSRIFSMTSAIVTRAAYGNKFKDQEELLALLKTSIELSSGFDLAYLFSSMKPIHFITGLKPKFKKIRNRVDNILEDIIIQNKEKNMRAKRGKASGGENLVEVLLRIQRSGSLEIPVTTNNIKAVIWDVFVAGTDTTATTLEWAMSEMMRNPKVMEKAQAEVRKAFKGKKTINDTHDMKELSYLKSVIKETLRLHPPTPLLLPRECREACKINGYEIPIKTIVIVNAWAIGRDPGYWHDAESFIPERFHDSSIDFKGNHFEYIPFGAGRRMCPGISFGLASIELPLARLLYHFDWELPNGMKAEDLDMAETLGSTTGRKNKLYLIPTPYN